MKLHAVWFEPLLVATGLAVAMLVAMWAERPAGCMLSPEASRVLVLSREIDQEHLATDIASAGRIARRYMLSTEDGASRQGRLVACEATLAQQIATRHGISPDRVRISGDDAPPPH